MERKLDKKIAGNYLFIVHDDNDAVTNKVIEKYLQFCENQEVIDNTVTHLLKNNKSSEVTEWGWVEIYKSIEVQNRWPIKNN